MGPEEFETDIGHIAPLSNDSIPDINQSHYCHSCETPFTGVYCTACGQKNDDYRRSLFSLIKEFISSLTAIESRIWRTWATLLFKPGKVAREYADGRRTHWSSPVRVYIAMSILLFGFLSITQIQLISIDVNVVPIEGVDKPNDELTADDLRMVPAMRFFETKREIDARNETRNFDLIARKMKADNGIKLDVDTEKLQQTLIEQTELALESGDITPDAAVRINNAIETLTNDEGGQPEPDIALPQNTAPKTIDADSDPTEDDTTDRPSSFTFSGFNGQVYQIESWSEILFTLIRTPETLNGTFFKYLPRIMFVMMPFTMLIGAMFIRGRGNALLYDHLVHAAYIHAVAFFLILLGIMLSFIFPGTAISRIIVIILMVYLPLSLKRMFNRGWFKTIWTSYGVGFIYTLVMTLIIGVLLGAQLMTTMTEMGTPLAS